MSDLSQFVIPRGFRFGACRAGLKASGRTDFALIVADAPASAAAAFTANRVTAAPLTVDKEHLTATGGKVRVVAINAGNANCAAGQAGPASHPAKTQSTGGGLCRQRGGGVPSPASGNPR